MKGEKLKTNHHIGLHHRSNSKVPRMESGRGVASFHFSMSTKTVGDCHYPVISPIPVRRLRVNQNHRSLGKSHRNSSPTPNRYGEAVCGTARVVCERVDARNAVTHSQAREPTSRILSRTSGAERKNRGGGIFSTTEIL
jgi:hypothetical protein